MYTCRFMRKQLKLYSLEANASERQFRNSLIALTFAKLPAFEEIIGRRVRDYRKRDSAVEAKRLDLRVLGRDIEREVATPRIFFASKGTDRGSLYGREGGARALVDIRESRVKSRDTSGIHFASGWLAYHIALRVCDIAPTRAGNGNVQRAYTRACCRA